MICPSCNGENTENYKFCRHCGAKRPETAATYVLPQDAPPLQPAPGVGQPTPTYGQPSPQPPYIPPAAPPPYVPPAVSTPKASSKKPLLIGAIAVLVIVCLAAAVFFGLKIWNPFMSTQMLVGFPNNSGEVDLYSFKVGDKEKGKQPIVEQVQQTQTNLYARTNDNLFRRMAKNLFNFGSFVPGSNNFLLWYREGDKTYIKQMKVGAKSPEDVINVSNANLSGFVGYNKNLGLYESLADGVRCYWVKPGAAADRLGKGIACLFSTDGSTLLIVSGASDNRKLEAIDVKNQKSYEILKDENGLQNWGISADGSKIAYVIQQHDKSRVTLIEKKNQSQLNESDEFPNFRNLSFALTGTNLFYIVANSDGEEELYVMSSKENKLIATANNISAQFSPKGDQLIYATMDKDGAKTLYVHPMSGGDDVELANGNPLFFNITYSPERILYAVKDGKELIISSTDIKGKNGAELYRQQDMDIQSINQVPGQKQLYLLLRDTDGKFSLFVTPFDKNSGFNLMESWAEISLLSISPDGKTLAFTGRESANDDHYLFSIQSKEGANPVELDTDTRDISNAAFTGDGSKVIYTATTGTHPDEIEVRQVKASGGNSETLYSGAFLVDIQWMEINPFYPLYFQ